MARKGTLTDRIRAKLADGKVGHESKSFYTTVLALIDFTSDDDIPNLRAVKSLFGANGAGAMVPFVAVSTMTINWQTDMPPGSASTYAVLFGNNYPKPFVYDDADNMMDFSLQANRVTPGDISTNLATLVFDFGIVRTGTIQF